jgi:hypothetical protein
MAQVYNSDLLKELRDASKLQQLSESIPNQLDTKIVPVIEVNPKLLRVVNIIRGTAKTTTGSATIYTTPTDRDFYLTAITFAVTKNAACDVASGRYGLQMYIDGAAQVIGMVSVQTLTASDIATSMTFDTPIKIDRNTSIVTAGGVSFTAGAMITTTSILGFTVENTNA